MKTPAVVSAAAAAAIVVLSLAGTAGRAAAQIPSGCSELCGVSCVKPLAIPDRWDDVTPIFGYTGSIVNGRMLPNWQNNGKYDLEAFTDTNGDGKWDPGEPYIDGNANGVYDAEAYDPLTTGYVADPTAGNALTPAGDLGRGLTLEPGYAASPVTASYQPLDFPPVNEGTPIAGSDAFGANLSGCNASSIDPGDALQVESGSMTGPVNVGMRDLIAQDANAYWDPATGTVQGSAFALSPRVIFIVAYDPSIYPAAGPLWVVGRKVIPMFLEQMVGTGAANVRLLRVRTTGAACSGSSAGAWFYACATPASPATWGRVKASYR